MSIELVDGKPKVEWEPKTNHWTGAEIPAVLRGAATEDRVAERAAAGDKSPLPALNQDRYRVRSLHRPLAEMRPTLPRTAESWRRVLKDLSAAARFFTTH